jgi:hypothetical protein
MKFMGWDWAQLKRTPASRVRAAIALMAEIADAD